MGHIFVNHINNQVQVNNYYHGLPLTRKKTQKSEVSTNLQWVFGTFVLPLTMGILISISIYF